MFGNLCYKSSYLHDLTKIDVIVDGQESLTGLRSGHFDVK